MAYEVFRRTGVRVDALAFSLVPDGRIALNAAVCRVLVGAGIKSVLLLWDKANHKFAVKAAPKNEANAYAVSIASSHSGSIRAKAFLAHIGWNARTRETLSATWNEKEKMFEVTLPERSVKSAGGPSRKGQN